MYYLKKRFSKIFIFLISISFFWISCASAPEKTDVNLENKIELETLSEITSETDSQLQNNVQSDEESEIAIESKEIELPSEPEISSINLLFAGDIMAHTENYQISDFSKIWRDVKDTISNADLAFANIESPIDTTKTESSYPTFNMSEKYVKAAIAAGFDAFSLCNNHTNDQGLNGILETIKTTERLAAETESSSEKIYFSGLRQKNAAYTYNIIEKNGWKILFLPITELLNGPRHSEYINFVSPGKESRKKFIDYCKKLRDENECDLFILSVHTSEPEYTRAITESQNNFYMNLLDAGVDIVWANHAHIIKDRKFVFNTENQTQKLIMYANGNTISGQRRNPALTSQNPNGERDNTGDGLLYSLTLEKENGKIRIQNAKPIFITTYINTANEYVIKKLDDEFVAYLEDVGRKDWAQYIRRRIKITNSETRDLILDCLENNQVVIVESPTGSGKTTQIPVILYEAGYATNGMIAVTQPRRIAALSVSEFISKQLGTTYPGLVGYKMRFEDKTDSSTRIKIMTDGILLQEMKLDPWLSKYSVIMVDEAHERSLNIDFVLGLLKRVLKERKDFHVIVSSATMNTQSFSEYFDNAPIVSIDTVTYPVSIIYDPIKSGTTTLTDTGCDALLTKIYNTVDRVLDNDEEGGILIFLPGEKIIKDCVDRLYYSPIGRRLHILPLYGRLSKEEQERVFEEAPEGKKKVVISTNIAETSVTISDITTVIDSGLCKLNFYNPRNFTSSLIENTVSKASCNQRKGRAGRTHSGNCYRLYSRTDFETREMYTTEEIYRTDLSEVVLRMAELGITDFYDFDFIASPGREGIIGAVDTLNMLGALDKDNSLSEIGKMMVKFPLEPRISRIIVEAIMRFPQVLDKVLIAASFLSANSPFILPQNEEMEARKAHHRFRDMQGDFGTYLNLYAAFKQTDNREKFCKRNYLDARVMAEIENINFQLSQIVGDGFGIPITEGTGSNADYLCCIAAGMIQFVCIRTGRESYRSLTADHICIHPGSVMFKQDPVFIVAGEIVRTSRVFAMSVSPLTRPLLDSINPSLYERLKACKTSKTEDLLSSARKATEKKQVEVIKKTKGKAKAETDSKQVATDSDFSLGGFIFNTTKIKGKKVAILPFEQLKYAIPAEKDKNKLAACGNLKGRITTKDHGLMMDCEKMSLIIDVFNNIDLTPISEKKWNRKMNVNINDPLEKEQLIDSLDVVLRTAIAKQKNKEYGFITLFTDSKGNYWFKVSRGFTTALTETHASLEALIEENVDFSDEEQEKINEKLRLVNKMYNS